MGTLLNDVGEPKSYLGADIGEQMGILGDTWLNSPDQFLNKANTTVE